MDSENELKVLISADEYDQKLNEMLREKLNKPKLEVTATQDRKAYVFSEFCDANVQALSHCQSEMMKLYRTK